MFGLKVAITVIIRWFGKFKKLTTGKRNLHFIEIKGFGKLTSNFCPREPTTIYCVFHFKEGNLDNSLFFR